MLSSDREAAMKDLVERVKKCTKCKLHVGRRNPVVGRGSLYSKVMFIGEAPGVKEDEEGVKNLYKTVDRVIEVWFTMKGGEKDTLNKR